jgi:F0F1-type ATP synthase delta subunit
VGTEVFQISKHVLADLANEDVHARVVDIFLQRLAEEEGEAATRLEAALEGSSGTLEVRTSVALDAEQRQRVERTMRNYTDGSRDLSFQESADILCGIEVHANGTVVSYGLGDYLDGVEDRLGELLSPR